MAKSYHNKLIIKTALKVSSDFTAIPIERLKSKTNKREVVEGRMVACMLILKYSHNMTLDEIGRELGGKKHCGIIHYQKLHDNLIKTNRAYKSIYDAAHRRFRILTGIDEDGLNTLRNTIIELIEEYKHLKKTTKTWKKIKKDEKERPTTQTADPKSIVAA